MYSIKAKKRGVTLIEVVSFLFIITIIFTITFPFMMKIKGTNLDRETNKVILELRYAKSLAVSLDTDVYVKFFDREELGYTTMKYYADKEKHGEYKFSKGYNLIKENDDLYKEDIVFRPDGTLNHRATTLKINDINTKEVNKVTLTIGYTRIMKVN